jgi:hypothetical protein
MAEEEVKTEEVAVPEKKYTDDDINKIVASRKGEAVEKLLKDLGMSDAGTLKENLAKLKAFEDSQKTEVEKQTAALTAKDAEAQAARKEADEARAEVEAVRQGVNPDKAGKLVKLALAGGYEGATIADKVKAALEDFPEFKGAVPIVPSLGARIKSQTTPETDKIRNEFRAGLGIK